MTGAIMHGCDIGPAMNPKLREEYGTARDGILAHESLAELARKTDWGSARLRCKSGYLVR